MRSIRTTLAVACLLGLWVVATPSTAAPKPAPDGAEVPWPAGNVRANEVTFGFSLHHDSKRPRKDLDAELVRAFKQKLPKFKLVAATGKAPALGTIARLSTTTKGIDAGYVASAGRLLDAPATRRLIGPHAVETFVVRATVANAAKALAGTLSALAMLAPAFEAVVDDHDARLYLTSGQFQQRVNLGFEQEVPVVTSHITIHGYQQPDGTLRSVTVGLPKLGLPNLVVQSHVPSTARQVGPVLSLLAQALLEKGELTQKGAFLLDLATVTSGAVRRPVEAKVGAGGTGRTLLKLAVARREAGDDEGPLMSVTLDEGAGGLFERQLQALSSFFGPPEPFRRGDPDPTEARQAAARGRLLKMKPGWLTGRGPGERLVVVAPHKSEAFSDDVVWVEVLRWSGSTLSGVVVQAPAKLKGLRPGARVDVEERRVIDYLYTHPDGRTEGNEAPGE